MVVKRAMAERKHRHSQFLELARCPHCQTAVPTLASKAEFSTLDHTGRLRRHWRAYVCKSCGGAVLAGALAVQIAPGEIRELEIAELYPVHTAVDETVPSRARDFLTQARESIHAPDGAVMLAASAVDAMLKTKNFKSGSLYSRIDKAVQNGTITKDMGRWAHQVRLDANDPRHADEEAPPHTPASARLAVEFAEALAEFMFVLPARVTRGVAESAPSAGKDAKKSDQK